MLTVQLYEMTAKFPREELYGITNQIRRAAASIGANVAEGCGRRSDAEFGRFLLIAMGSDSELAYHLLLARDLHLLPESEYVRLDQELTEVRKMLTSLTLKVKPAVAGASAIAVKMAKS